MFSTQVLDPDAKANLSLLERNNLLDEWLKKISKTEFYENKKQREKFKNTKDFVEISDKWVYEEPTLPQFKVSQFTQPTKLNTISFHLGTPRWNNINLRN